MKMPYELFGFECGKGWKPLVDKLIADLRAVGWNGDIHQIKEKFGGLRFYIGEGNEKIWDLIDRASKESYTICEECGEPGIFRRGGWIKTLCDLHHEERQKRYATIGN